MIGIEASDLRRHHLAVIVGVLGIYCLVGGLMIFFGWGPSWYHASVTLASIAMLLPAIALVRQRSAAGPHGPA